MECVVDELTLLGYSTNLIKDWFLDQAVVWCVYNPRMTDLNTTTFSSAYVPYLSAFSRFFQFIILFLNRIRHSLNPSHLLFTSSLLKYWYKRDLTILPTILKIISRPGFRLLLKRHSIRFLSLVALLLFLFRIHSSGHHRAFLNPIRSYLPRIYLRGVVKGKCVCNFHKLIS